MNIYNSVVTVVQANQGRAPGPAPSLPPWRDPRGIFPPPFPGPPNSYVLPPPPPPPPPDYGAGVSGASGVAGAVPGAGVGGPVDAGAVPGVSGAAGATSVSRSNYLKRTGSLPFKGPPEKKSRPSGSHPWKQLPLSRSLEAPTVPVPPRFLLIVLGPTACLV